MTAKIISGTEVAKTIREELQKEVADLKAKHNIVPGLAVVLDRRRPGFQKLRRRQRQSRGGARYLFSENQSARIHTRIGIALADQIN